MGLLGKKKYIINLANLYMNFIFYALYTLCIQYHILSQINTDCHCSFDLLRYKCYRKSSTPTLMVVIKFLRSFTELL